MHHSNFILLALSASSLLSHVAALPSDEAVMLKVDEQGNVLDELPADAQLTEEQPQEEPLIEAPEEESLEVDDEQCEEDGEDTPEQSFGTPEQTYEETPAEENGGGDGAPIDQGVPEDVGTPIDQGVPENVGIPIDQGVPEDIPADGTPIDQGVPAGGDNPSQSYDDPKQSADGPQQGVVGGPEDAFAAPEETTEETPAPESSTESETPGDVANLQNNSAFKIGASSFWLASLFASLLL